MSASCLAIEIGGTKLQLAVGQEPGGQWQHLEHVPVEPGQGASGILRQIEQRAGALVRQYAVRAVGIGFGGPVNARTGCAVTSHQIRGWDNFPLRQWCQEKLGLPLALANDCDAAALAEARYGAGQGADRVFYVTVGTGVGGGLVLHGVLEGASRPAMAEIGHMRFGLHATDPEQTIESLASGWGIARNAQRKAEESRAQQRTDPHWCDAIDACVGPEGFADTRRLAELARHGNPIAQQAFDQATRAIGWGVAQVVTLLAVEVVVIGGGVSQSGEQLFWRPLRDRVAEYVFPPLAGSYVLRPAALGSEVVLHGALAMAGTMAGTLSSVGAPLPGDTR